MNFPVFFSKSDVYKRIKNALCEKKVNKKTAVALSLIILIFCASCISNPQVPAGTSAAAPRQTNDLQSRGTSSFVGHKEKEMVLPDFVYEGSDEKKALIYKANADWMKNGSHGGFVVLASKLFGYYPQGDKIKILTIIADSEYRLYGNELSEVSGGVTPTAITLSKKADGTFQLEKYELPKDGTFYGKSIRSFCTQPVSGEPINGVAEQILNFHDTDELTREKYQNLANHLHQNGISDAVLKDSYHKTVFSLKDYH